MAQFYLREACTKKSETNFIVSNDTMKGPESSKKNFFLIMKISVTVKIHPLCNPDQRENFKWAHGAQFT